MRRRNLEVLLVHIMVTPMADKNFRKDELAAYYPVSDKISMKYQNESGKTVNGHVIADSSKYGISNKYLAFWREA